MSKILVVDDDQDMVEALRVILESNNYEVISASNGEEGYVKVQTDRPDLIILDIMMTTKDQGLQICYKLKNDPQYSNIPILILTAVTERTGFRFSPGEDREWLPADDYIDKPVQPDDLLTRIKNLLKK